MLGQPTVQAKTNPVRRSVKALVVAGDRILLVKERHTNGSEFWTLPGGGVKGTESLREALTRELLEELWCVPTVGSSLGSLWYAHTTPGRGLSYWQVFRCWLHTRPLPAHDEGILDTKWVRRQNLPPRTLVQVRYLLSDGEVPSVERLASTERPFAPS